jgi:hypothetical protein
MFYRFHLHTRSGVFETLHRSALLFQQFIVDAWASTIRSDLDFIRFNQGKIRAELNGGDFDGQYRLIYRCRLSTSENLGFTLTRMQFPIRLAFAMTINKSQGQSLLYVGVDLRKPVFTYGQLYVALSRTTDINNVAVLFSSTNPERVTDNIVYPEVLCPFYPRC